MTLWEWCGITATVITGVIVIASLVVRWERRDKALSMPVRSPERRMLGGGCDE